MVASAQRPRLVAVACLCLSVLLGVPVAAAQREVVVTPFAGYRVGGGLTDDLGRHWDIVDALSYGGMLEVGMGRGAGASFVYSHQDSKINGPSSTPHYDIKVDNWLIGGWREVGSPRGSVRPVGQGFLGLSHFSSSDGSLASADRFAFGLGLGLRGGRAGGRVGLRLDARGVFTFATSGGGWWCSSGSGCAVSVSGKALFQADFTGGLSIRLGGGGRR